MYSPKIVLWTDLFLSASASITLLPTIDQALIGPVYLPPANVSFQAFSEASSNLRESINKAIQTGNSSFGPVDTQTTSFSASIFSAASNETLFDFHFEAPQLKGSYTKGRLTDATVYRTGSLGKLLTIYAFLVDIGDRVYLDPITKYVVSLKNLTIVQENSDS